MDRTEKSRRTMAKSTVDWEAARSRIAALGDMLEDNTATEERDFHRIIRERTAKLAQPARESGPAKGTRELIGFNLGREVYGIETDFVNEVLPLTDLTPLPCVPQFIAGITNSRGRIVSVMNLKQFFGLPEQGLPHLAQVLILTDGTMEFGVLADSIEGIKPMDRTRLQPVSTIFKGIRQEYLMGIVADGTIVLNAERLLSERQLRVHDDGGK